MKKIAKPSSTKATEPKTAKNNTDRRNEMNDPKNAGGKGITNPRGADKGGNR